MQHHGHHQPAGPTIADWLPVILLTVVGLLYLSGVFYSKRAKRGWSGWRTVSFLTGVVLLCIAMLPSLMNWAHQDLRGHMVQHLLIGMYAPLFLVFGAPITLLLKAFPVAAARTVTNILRSRPFYILSHPFSAFLFNMGGMYVLYLTPLYVKSLSNPYLHYLIHIHFLLAGFLFTWSIIGPDPVPKKPGILIKLSVLFISIASHAFLSKFMYAFSYPLHSPHSVGQIQEAAKLMYYWGDLSELLLTIALFTLWYRKRPKSNYSLASPTV